MSSSFSYETMPSKLQQPSTTETDVPDNTILDDHDGSVVEILPPEAFSDTKIEHPTGDEPHAINNPRFVTFRRITDRYSACSHEPGGVFETGSHRNSKRIYDFQDPG